MFSHRIPSTLRENAIARAIADSRRSGRSVTDLTVSNPTTVGIEYPVDLLTALGDVTAMVYRPVAFGLQCAREAVAADFARRAHLVDPSTVVLTASTSEAYSWLFKLLCNPGDEVLIPEPSYPLFEHLTALDAVQAVPYRLDYHGLWAIDRETVERALSDRTRAILVVSPNNPTGSMLRADDLRWLRSETARRRLPLISDEVFADFPIAPGPDAASSALDAGRRSDVLTIVLGGLSKSLGLPQLKIGWLLLDGPPREVSTALERLEVIADTYLSVNTPVQVALPWLFERGAAVRDAIATRVKRNLATLDQLALAHPACTALRVEGGWSAVIRVPARRTEEALVLEVLQQDGVLVHPGYFFDFAHEAFVVVSLLPPEDEFEEGVHALMKRASA